MKKTHIFLTIGLLTLFSGCLEEQHIIPVKSTIRSVKSNSNLNTGAQIDGPAIIRDQIVVRYTNKNLSTSQKVTIQNYYEGLYDFTILSTKTCNCNINDLELWTIDTTQVAYLGIEHVVNGLASNTGEGDLSGDYQFTIEIINDTLKGEVFTGISDRIVVENNPSAVKIAIIDTGVDYDYFDKRFLYNSSGTPGCGPSEVSGWDFVNDDNDPRDDKGHGTFVTKIITNTLDNLSIPFEILPIKAFDEDGHGTYFSAICAISYILNKPDIDLVNMSFGWGQLDTQVIMKGLFDEISNQILFVTSAGNDGLDTDSQGNMHFPSGYESENLLTVAGYVQSDDPNQAMDYEGSGELNSLVLSPDSNFGVSSIDITAPFDFDLTLQSPKYLINVSVEGTSYSSPFALVRGAQLLYNSSFSPYTLKRQIITTGYRSQAMNGMVSSGKALSGRINTPQSRQVFVD